MILSMWYIAPSLPWGKDNVSVSSQGLDIAIKYIAKKYLYWLNLIRLLSHLYWFVSNQGLYRLETLRIKYLVTKMCRITTASYIVVLWFDNVMSECIFWWLWCPSHWKPIHTSKAFKNEQPIISWNEPRCVSYDVYSAMNAQCAEYLPWFNNNDYHTTGNIAFVWQKCHQCSIDIEHRLNMKSRPIFTQILSFSESWHLMEIHFSLGKNGLIKSFVKI